MWNKIILIVSLQAAFMLGAVAQQDVDIAYIIPEKVDAGSEIPVNVNIKKGNLGGIARFQLEFPNGFEVIEKKSANGEFRFNNQRLIIQWLKLPVSEEIELSFTIKINSTLEGFFVIKGAFHYIEGNTKKKKEIYPHILTVNPLDVSSENMVAANNEGEYFDISKVVKDEISCVRQKPTLDENNEILVNLLITKSDLNKFGKIEEQIPVGYKAVNVASKGAIFVFNQKNRIVKFMWMNLPMDAQFKVSYKLIPVVDNPKEAFIITGKFLYAENNTTKEVEVVERNIQF